MRRTRLVENREVFLAYVLARYNFSTIEGLYHRFPLVWQRRDKYKYYRHVCLERPLLKEEYKVKFAYCLFEAANDDQTIFNALFDELYKQNPRFYKEIKNKLGKHPVLKEVELKKFIYQEKPDEQEFLIYLSVLDFFLEKQGVNYEVKNTFNTLKKSVLEKEQIFFEFEEESYFYLKNQLVKSNSLFSKRIKSFCRGYSDYLGKNVVDFLNAKLESFFQSAESHKVIQWLKDLGLWTQRMDYRLTQADVYQLMALLLCTDEDEEYGTDEEQTVRLGEFVLPMPIFVAFEQSLYELLPYFVLSNIMQKNREFFLQSCHTKDPSISKQLEKEVNRLKHELTRVKEMNTDLKSLLGKQKDALEKANKTKMKELESTLITTLKEKERLEQELISLQGEYATLKLSIKEGSPSVNHMTEIVVDEALDIEKINCPEVMIVGGATPTVQKLKKILPNCKYFEVDKRYNDQYFNGVKLAILLTNILNHGMTRKLDKHCPQIKKKSLSMTNVDLIVKEIAKQLEDI